VGPLKYDLGVLRTDIFLQSSRQRADSIPQFDVPLQGNDFDLLRFQIDGGKGFRDRPLKGARIDHTGRAELIVVRLMRMPVEKEIKLPGPLEIAQDLVHVAMHKGDLTSLQLQPAIRLMQFAVYGFDGFLQAFIVVIAVAKYEMSVKSVEETNRRG